MFDVSAQISSIIQMLDESISYLRSLPVEDRLTRENFPVLEKSLNLLLKIEQRNRDSADLDAIAKMSPEELNQLALDATKALEQAGIYIPEHNTKGTKKKAQS
jgi:hypothetical protein